MQHRIHDSLPVVFWYITHSKSYQSILKFNIGRVRQHIAGARSILFQGVVDGTDDGFIVSVLYLFQFLSNLFPQPE